MKKIYTSYSLNTTPTNSWRNNTPPHQFRCVFSNQLNIIVMNLAEVKKKVNVETLPLQRVVDTKTGEVTPWLSYWDNDKRVRVSIHDDVYGVVRESTNLGIKTTIKQPTKDGVVDPTRKPYTQHIIVKYNDQNIVDTL